MIYCCDWHGFGLAACPPDQGGEGVIANFRSFMVRNYFLQLIVLQISTALTGRWVVGCGRTTPVNEFLSFWCVSTCKTNFSLGKPLWNKRQGNTLALKKGGALLVVSLSSIFSVQPVQSHTPIIILLYSSGQKRNQKWTLLVVSLHGTDVVFPQGRSCKKQKQEQEQESWCYLKLNSDWKLDSTCINSIHWIKLN